MLKTFGVSLLSGGLDSTTVTAYAKSRIDDLTSLTFMYGQTHSKEVECARRISSMLGVRHKLIDISFLRDVAWYSALTNPDDFKIPVGRRDDEIGSGVPISYVPMRNTIFLYLASSYLESQDLHAIEIGGIDSSQIKASIFMAPNEIDYSGYPDCRPEFYEQFANILKAGSKLSSQYEIHVSIETPIIHMSKAQIIKMAVELNLPLQHTWSCYTGEEEPCGECDSCKLRSNGFREAGLIDPLITKNGI